MGILPSVAARELGVSVRCLQSWEKKGKIKSDRTAGNWRTYDHAAIAKLKVELEQRRHAAEQPARVSRRSR